MLNKPQQFGQQAEAMAARFLKKQGYKIVARNHRTRSGEIDIIARDSDTLVFVEVKARTSERYGTAKAAVTAHKQRQIAKVALAYLKKTAQSHVKARFDVVTVTRRQGTHDIDLIRNAFGLNYG
ncbi:MAG: YraN family protein [Desulfobacterales bacterium]|jgi:putative endonuclease